VAGAPLPGKRAHGGGDQGLMDEQLRGMTVPLVTPFRANGSEPPSVSTRNGPPESPIKRFRLWMIDSTVRRQLAHVRALSWVRV